MALLAMDGFDHYKVEADMNARTGNLIYTSSFSPGFQSPGRNGYGKCYLLGQLGGLLMTPNERRDTWVLGFAAYIEAGNSNQIYFNDYVADPVNGKTQCSIFFGGGGNTFQVYDKSGALVGVAPNNSLPPATWVFIEFKIKINATAGAFHIRVNGAPVLDVTGVDTQLSANAWSDGFWMRAGYGANRLIDDLYICDTTPSANPTYPMDDFMGDVRVQTLFPIGAGTSTQWTPLTGSNWQEVSETAFDGDTSYNASSTTGQTDLFTFQSLVGGLPQIIAVGVTGAFRKDDVGTRLINNRLVSGTATFTGANQNVSPNYGYYSDVIPVDPNTSAAWTAAAVNGLQAGYTLNT